MRYAVKKNTTVIIDGSENPIEVMTQNFTNAGFSESEVEILTEEEYQTRKELEPVEPQPPTGMELLRLENAQSNAEMFEMILMMSGGDI